MVKRRISIYTRKMPRLISGHFELQREGVLMDAKLVVIHQKYRLEPGERSRSQTILFFEQF